MRTNLVLMSIVAFATGCGYFQQMQADRQWVREDLTSLCASFPKPENAVEIETHEVISPENGNITYTYDVPSSCDEARRALFDYWKNTHWEPTRPGSTYYFKDKYIVDASCESSTKPKRITVSCGWDSAGRFKDTLK